MILYMDRYHGGDMLFLQAFVRAMASRTSVTPVMVFHGAGASVERLFEQEGHFVERVGGVMAPTDQQERVLLERGMRETARKLSALLTDAVIPAVPLMGCDRGMLTTSASGDVHLGNVAWLSGLLEKQVIPVIAGLTIREGTSAVEEVSVARAMAQLVGALSLRGVALFAKGGRIPENEAGSRRILWDQFVADGLATEPDVAKQLLRAGVRVHLVTPELLHTRSPIEWPHVEHS